MSRLPDEIKNKLLEIERLSKTREKLAEEVLDWFKGNLDKIGVKSVEAIQGTLEDAMFNNHLPNEEPYTVNDFLRDLDSGKFDNREPINYNELFN